MGGAPLGSASDEMSASGGASSSGAAHGRVRAASLRNGGPQPGAATHMVTPEPPPHRRARAARVAPASAASAAIADDDLSGDEGW
jgi:hypothetical protein